MVSIDALIRAAPKAELHLHIEGTLEPEMMFALAERNGISLPYADVAEARRAYDFNDLQSFLDVYYQGAQVLVRDEDFFDLTAAYLARMSLENVRHVEIFFDPQTHTDRGVPFDCVVNGILDAMHEANTRLGITSQLILCFLRHLDAASAEATLDAALSYRGRIVGVGLDSAELGNPPSRFSQVFARARKAGFRVVAHAGEEGPPDYIWEALDALGAQRIDHGVRCLEDSGLVDRLVRDAVPLTVCPLSNVKLKVFQRLQDHNLQRLLQAGLMVTVNSDDPAYFGGYLTDNLLAVQRALELTESDVRVLLKNGFRASFLASAEVEAYCAEIDRVGRATSPPLAKGKR